MSDYILLKIKENQISVFNGIVCGKPKFEIVEKNRALQCVIFSDYKEINSLKTNNRHFWKDLEFFETILASELKKKIFEILP